MNARSLPITGILSILGGALVALVTAGWAPKAQAASLYRPPDMEKEIFKPLQ